jgi:hypothetical protein
MKRKANIWQKFNNKYTYSPVRCIINMALTAFRYEKILRLIVVCLCFSICFIENTYQTQIVNFEDNFKKSNFSKIIEIYKSFIQIEKALRLVPRARGIKNNTEHLNTVVGQVR